MNIYERTQHYVHEKINKTRLDNIQFSLEVSARNPIYFNSETILFTIQTVKI